MKIQQVLLGGMAAVLTIGALVTSIGEAIYSQPAPGPGTSVMVPGPAYRPLEPHPLLCRTNQTIICDLIV